MGKRWINNMILVFSAIWYFGCQKETPIPPCSPFSSCTGFQSCGPNSTRLAYGSDPRQVFELIKAENTPNAPVVIYIHGGAWFSGPKADAFPPDINPPGGFNAIPIGIIRKRLVDDKKCAFVHLKYSLMQGSETNFSQNAGYVEKVLDDIQAAVDFIKNNAACLDVDPTRFIFIGESAGGHIALMYAYTRSDPAITKAVGSIYAPTDLQTFGAYLQAQECYDNQSDNPCVFDKYAYFFGTSTTDQGNVVNWDGVNSLNCSEPKTATFNLVQCLAGESISDPATNARLLAISPKYALNAAKNIPTFIQHGSDDRVVPYLQAQQSMEAELASLGGVETSTACSSCKHKVKVYDLFDHGWASPSQLLWPNLVFYDLDAATNGNCPLPFTNSGNYNLLHQDMVDWLAARL